MQGAVSSSARFSLQAEAPNAWASLAGVVPLVEAPSIALAIEPAGELALANDALTAQGAFETALPSGDVVGLALVAGRGPVRCIQEAPAPPPRLAVIVDAIELR